MVKYWKEMKVCYKHKDYYSLSQSSHSACVIYHIQIRDHTGSAVTMTTAIVLSTYIKYHMYV